MASTPPIAISNPLLDPETLKSLGGLYIIAEALVSGLQHGRHANPDRGISTEFYDYRAYAAGDDLRHVDWKHFGRSDRLYVRRYRHFADLTVRLVVDASASMSFAGIAPRTGDPSKWDVARWLAAALAYLTTRQADQIGLTVLHGLTLPDEAAGTRRHPESADGRRIITPGRSWNHLSRIITALEKTAPAGRPSEDMRSRWGDETAAAGHKVLLFSDCIDDHGPMLDAVHRYRSRGNDVTVVQVLTPDELNPTVTGSARVEDPESRLRTSVRFDEVHQSYLDRVRAHIDSLHRTVHMLGGAHYLVTTNDPPLYSLRRVLGLEPHTGLPTTRWTP